MKMAPLVKARSIAGPTPHLSPPYPLGSNSLCDHPYTENLTRPRPCNPHQPVGGGPCKRSIRVITVRLNRW